MASESASSWAALQGASEDGAKAVGPARQPSFGGSAREEGVFPLDEHNARLLDLCAPRDWAPPPEEDVLYDLVAVGAGAGGLVSSKQSARRGWRSALVERHIAGGDCLNVGCVPSKAVLHCAKAFREMAKLEGLGVRAAASIDFAAVMERMRRLRAKIAPADSFKGASKLGVDVFQGHARFTGPHTLQVGARTLRFRKAVIATGGRAALPEELEGLDSVAFHTNASVFNMRELPRSMLIVGTGAVALELGQAFRSFGCEVTCLGRGDRVLSSEDPEVSEHMRKTLEEEGIRFAMGVRLTRVEPVGATGSRVRVRGTDRDSGAAVAFEADTLLVAAGRQPNVEDLGLEKAGVRFDPRQGVHVDSLLCTSNPDILAVGDVVAGGLRLTHLSGTHAQMAVGNALFGEQNRHTELVVPKVVYTEPEVASVGLSESQARAAGVPVRVYTAALDHNDRAIVEGAAAGMARIVCRQGSEEILGATLVAKGAGEMISELTVAIQFGIGLGFDRGLGAVIRSYPTMSECIGGCAFQFKMQHWKQRGRDGRIEATPYAAAPLAAALAAGGRHSNGESLSLSAGQVLGLCALSTAVAAALGASLARAYH